LAKVEKVHGGHGGEDNELFKKIIV